MKIKWAFIINPVAGNGFCEKYSPQVKEAIKKRNLSAEISYTEYKGHGTELARQFVDNGCTHIVAVGGDGTINEVATALMKKKNVILGIVPAGTGNDLVQITGLTGPFEDSDWDIFFKENTTLMDAGICNGHYFYNGMGLGFDAQVAAENYNGVEKVKKGGAYKYIWHIIKTILLYREKEIRSESGGEHIKRPCFINTVSNGRRYAGGFYLTPEAFADDRLLDICMIEKLSIIRRLRLLPRVSKGTHIFEKDVKYYKTNALTIEFTDEVPYHIDGELYFGKKFDITIAPDQVRVIYNPAGSHYFTNN